MRDAHVQSQDPFEPFLVIDLFCLWPLTCAAWSLACASCHDFGAKEAVDMAKAVAIIMIYPTSLVALLIIMHSATMGFAGGADVNMWNDMEGETIQVYCGAHSWRERKLQFGQHYGWSFEPGKGGTNRWMCGFKWGSKVQQFLVWGDTGMSITAPESRPCLHCEWYVKKQGFYLLSNGIEPAVLYHEWL